MHYSGIGLKAAALTWIPQMNHLLCHFFLHSQCDLRAFIQHLPMCGWWFFSQDLPSSSTACSPVCCSCLWSSWAPGSVWASCCADCWTAGTWPGWWRWTMGRESWSGLWLLTGAAGSDCCCWSDSSHLGGKNRVMSRVRKAISEWEMNRKRWTAELTELPVQSYLLYTSQTLLHQTSAGEREHKAIECVVCAAAPSAGQDC